MEAFEGSKNAYKTLKEKVKLAGKKALKHAKKVAGIHSGPTTEANPSYFIVIASQGAMVRKEIGLDSRAVHGLNRGDLVTCVEILGRRARIIEPVEGWISIRTQENESILMKTIAPDISVQAVQMEKRFAKLKSQQPHSENCDTVVPVAGQSSSLPEFPNKESDVSTVVTLKHALTFRDSPGTTTPDTAIPKLCIPGTAFSTRKGGNESVTPDLIDLLSDEVASSVAQARKTDTILTPVVQLSPHSLKTREIIQPSSSREYDDPFSKLEYSTESPVQSTPTRGPQVAPARKDVTGIHSYQDWFS